MKLVDVHCHLAFNYFYKNMEDWMQKWKKNNVFLIGAVSMKLSEIKKTKDLADRYPDMIVPGYGIHPWKAHKVKEQDLETLKTMIISELEKGRKFFLGEIGLDHYFIKEKERYPAQKKVLNFFFELASKNNIPVNLHVTGAEKEVLEMIETWSLKPYLVNVHWYSGPINVLKKLVDLGVYFSITPAISYSLTHQRVVEQVPIEQLLTESDGNVKYKGIIGEPSLVSTVVEKISEIKGIDILEVEKQVIENVNRYLPSTI